MHDECEEIMDTNTAIKNQTVTDPVCGMQIDATSAAGRSEHAGETFFFCSGSCKQKFDREPAKYATHPKTVVALPKAQEDQGHSCCSHKRTPAKSDSDQKPAPTKPVPSKPGQPTDKCPCKDGSGKPQLTQAEPTQADLSTFLRALTLDVSVPFASPVAETVSEADGLNAGRWPGHAPSPADELLYAHHKLRC